MVRSNLFLTEAHDAWTRRRLISSIADVSGPVVPESAWRRLRDLAAACGEVELARQAEAARIEASPIDHSRSALPFTPLPAEPEGAPQRSPLAEASKAWGAREKLPPRTPRRACPPIAFNFDTHPQISENGYRLASFAVSGRMPMARRAWIMATLVTAGFAVRRENEDIHVAAHSRPNARQTAWLERLSRHPELVVAAR